MAAAKKNTKKATTPKAKAKVEATVAYEDEYIVEDNVKTEPVQEWEIKDRTYLLMGNKTPLVFTLPMRHTAKRPLLWYDAEVRHQRELRYATNQPSPFVDEQEGHVTLAHVVMRDGALFVPKEKQNLQKLMSLYHPLKDKIYYEVDDKQDAIDELDIMDLQFEAASAAKTMDIDLAEAIMRVEMGSKVAELSSKELRRDVRMFARNNPRLFLELANDENIAVRNVAVKAVEAGILSLAPDQRTFLWSSTSRKIMVVPFGENPYSALAAFFKTDEGIEIYQTIEKKLG